MQLNKPSGAFNVGFRHILVSVILNYALKMQQKKKNWMFVNTLHCVLFISVAPKLLSVEYLESLLKVIHFGYVSKKKI